MCDGSSRHNATIARAAKPAPARKVPAGPTRSHSAPATRLAASSATRLTLDCSAVEKSSSVVLALFVLLHKGRGGGMSDLFGGGVSTSMGGSSAAERTLDRLTIIVGLLWLVTIFGLLVLYRFFPDYGTL